MFSMVDCCVDLEVSPKVDLEFLWDVAHGVVLGVPGTVLGEGTGVPPNMDGILVMDGVLTMDGISLMVGVPLMDDVLNILCCRRNMKLMGFHRSSLK